VGKKGTHAHIMNGRLKLRGSYYADLECFNDYKSEITLQI